jgi:DNA-binding Lrp family transcriptional regulator
MVMYVDEKELALLAVLRENARASLLEVAKKIGMPVSTAHDKVHRYHGKVIVKHTALLNFEKLGLTRACIAVKTTETSRPRVQGFLSSHRGVNNLHKINSGYDFMAEIVGTDEKEIEDFTNELKTVPGVLDTVKFTIVEDILREEFVMGAKHDKNKN